jgi:hypothetical protein
MRGVSTRRDTEGKRLRKEIQKKECPHIPPPNGRPEVRIEIEGDGVVRRLARKSFHERYGTIGV